MTWCWSGTPPWTWAALSARTTSTRLISAPALLGGTLRVQGRRGGAISAPCPTSALTTLTLNRWVHFLFPLRVVKHNEARVQLYFEKLSYLLPVQRWRGWPDHAHSSLLPAEAWWVTSTPERREAEPVSFDSGRVRAWLGVQSPAPGDEQTSCSRAVQTEEVSDTSEIRAGGAGELC